MFSGEIIIYCTLILLDSTTLLLFVHHLNISWVFFLIGDHDTFEFSLQATVMQATIGASRLARFRHKLTAGKVYTVSGFDVGQCAQNFRLSNSSLQIRFNESTSFDELTEPVSPLPEEAFRFRNQSELVGLANTNTQLPG